ncbi:hypothetical protein AB0K15_46850 [Amycolatopsis sp. NPDC049253]|uniref:hypothetical protein n=1 Tax=Amycolatopsis sp. NPDC049253 TaxID=3155274 RepID=UPI003429B684
MIPHHFTEQLVAARQSELRAAASHHRAAALPRPRTLPTARQRLGWLLVHTGLRLVTARGQRAQITLPA